MDNTNQLTFAAARADYYMVERLVNNGFNINKKDGNGDTALHCAVRNACTNVAFFLIERGAAVDEMNADGNTALMLAKKGNDQQILQALEAISAPATYCPTDRVPRQWQHVLRAFQAVGAEEAVIADGALRNLFNDRAVKDIDIFLKDQGSTRKNKKLLKQVFGDPVSEEMVPIQGGGEAPIQFVGLGKPKKTLMYHWIQGFRSPPESSMKKWTILYSQEKYNITFIDGYLKKGVENFAEGLITTFDFGLCQIAYDGKNIITTASYRDDTRNKEISLQNETGSTKERLRRLRKEYPDWKLFAGAKKFKEGPRI